MNNPKSTEIISAIKLKFFKQGLIIGFCILSFLWVQILIHGTSYREEYYVFPGFLIYCAASFALIIKYGNRFIPIFERVGYALTFLYFSTHFLSELYMGLNKTELSIIKFLNWIPVMYGLAFLIFTPKKALRLSAIFLASIFIPGIGYGVAKWGKGGYVSDLTLLIQIYTSGVIYISLFYIIAALKDKFTEVEGWVKTATSRADTDSLTNALSRVKIIEILDSYISSSAVTNLPFSVAFIDVDHLKVINDTYGHTTGDYVLQHIVEIIGASLRENDTLGRIGGDEFLLLLPDAGASKASIIAERLKQNISNTTFENIDSVNISIGVATIEHGDSKESILTRADAQMYQQKRELLQKHLMPS